MNFSGNGLSSRIKQSGGFQTLQKQQTQVQQNNLHGLGIHPCLMLVGPPLAITAADGVFRMPVPATDYVGPLLVQAEFAGVSPGYAPGSFSNVIRL